MAFSLGRSPTPQKSTPFLPSSFFILNSSFFTILHVLESPKATIAEKLKAAEVLCKLAKTQTKLEIDTFSNLKEHVLEAQYAAMNLEYAYEDKKQLDITEDRLHEIEAETTDHEGVTHDEFYAQAPPEHDFTPDGHLAFDQTLPHKTHQGPVQGLQALEPSLQGVHACAVPQTNLTSQEQPHVDSQGPRPWLNATTRNPASH